MSDVSIIGSGGMAAAIGRLAVRAGHAVGVAARDADKARALADQIGAGAKAEVFGAAPSGDIVILAVPYAGVLEVVTQYGNALAGKLIIDITNPINSDFTDFVTPADSSGAEEIAKIASPDAKIVKGFNFQFAQVLANGAFQGRPLDVFIAGDDVPSKQRASSFIQSLGLRAMDAGPLNMAHALESFAMLSLGLVANSVAHTNFALGVKRVG